MANNLKALRNSRGWSQDQTAEAMGTTRNMLAKLEGGARRLSTVWIDKAASAFGIDPADVVRESAFVSVKGIVGASEDGAAIIYGDDPGILGFVKAPFNSTPSTVAFEVRGSSMRGVAENGWYVFCDHRQDGLDDSLIGELCIVGLADGRVLVKTPQRGRQAGRFDLEAHNAGTIRDVVIEWSAPVTCIVPKRFAKFEIEVAA